MDRQLLIGQERISEALASIAQSGRVAHAYLFYGPEGSGKKAAALELAASLFCKNVADGNPCGNCSECSRIFSLGHPDVHFMLPYPNETKADEIKQRLALLAENPYSVADFRRRPSLDSLDASSNKQIIYTVKRIGQELRHEMSLAAVEGGYRMAIITDADSMNPNAANAFLKLLEEPGERTVFVLTTDRPDRLLTTIRSRCQLIRFSRLADEEVSAALVERHGLEPGIAQTISRMADGSYSRAIDLASSDELFSLRSMVVEFLRIAFTGNPGQVTDYAEGLARMGRESLKFFMQLLLSWLRDLVLYRTVSFDAPIVNVDQKEEIQKFCQNLPSARLEEMVAQVEEGIRLVERNMNQRLTFIVLAQSLGNAMKGKSAGQLVQSLSEEPIA